MDENIDQHSLVEPEIQETSEPVQQHASIACSTIKEVHCTSLIEQQSEPVQQSETILNMKKLNLYYLKKMTH
jgi:hypothetical protein